MSERRTFRLSDEGLRRWVAAFIATAPLGCFVEVRPSTRSLEQNALLHSLIADTVRAGLATDTGRRLTEEEAKVAWVSAWMGEDSDIVAFGGRPVQLRRSTTTFTKAELASLIDFIEAESAKRAAEGKMKPLPVRKAA